MVIRLKHSTVLPILLLMLLFLLAGHGNILAAVLRDRITLCLTSLIPALYGCTAAAFLLRDSGAAAHLGRLLRPLGRLLRMSPDVLGIFLVSQLAGYPVGAVLLRRCAENGAVTSEDAARLSGICFGGGPAFLVGFAGAQLLGSAAAGWCLMAACILSSLILALCLRHAHAFTPQEATTPPCKLNAQLLTQAASDTVRTMAQICGMVLLSGMLICLCRVLPVLHLLQMLGSCCGLPPLTVEALFQALLDITQLQGLFCCGLPYHILFPLTAGLLSFGGLCVHLQCLAAGVRTLRPGRFLCIRLAAALLTAAIAALMMPLLPLPEAAAAFAQSPAVSKTGSVLPGLLIFLTGFPFLIKKD